MFREGSETFRSAGLDGNDSPKGTMMDDDQSNGDDDWTTWCNAKRGKSPATEPQFQVDPDHHRRL